ncbi:MAG TPA: hypothetical protein VGQ59_19270 [Cyclobacteriaceae bacterium]|jgi:hypothetical protein|nr:hypothetical protein [Cyclobacteriaceae bacterium]
MNKKGSNPGLNPFRKNGSLKNLLNISEAITVMLHFVLIGIKKPATPKEATGLSVKIFYPPGKVSYPYLPYEKIVK